MGVGYELAIIISHPTTASGITVLLKTRTKYQEFFPTLQCICENNRFLACLYFEQKRKVAIFGEYGIMADIP